jgi:hypothetical protein
LLKVGNPLQNKEEGLEVHLLLGKETRIIKERKILLKKLETIGFKRNASDAFVNIPQPIAIVLVCIIIRRTAQGRRLQTKRKKT